MNIFFLQYWKTFINKAYLEVSIKWYSYMQSFISLQSYNIFTTSLAESLHGIKTLEHVFEIAKQLVSDFTAYEFFK
ncbi:hypothetical protein C1646_686819, partial [Rhizophagus diaphanus]